MDLSVRTATILIVLAPAFAASGSGDAERHSNDKSARQQQASLDIARQMAYCWG